MKMEKTYEVDGCYVAYNDIRKIDNQPENWKWETGLNDKNGKPVLKGDIYFEECENDEGDVRIFYVVTWIKEWAMWALLNTGELLDYEDNGIDALERDTVMKNTFIISADEFKYLHYKGNKIDNPELIKSLHTFE